VDRWISVLTASATDRQLWRLLSPIHFHFVVATVADVAAVEALVLLENVAMPKSHKVATAPPLLRLTREHYVVDASPTSIPLL
jgi:hypothetical protein